MSENIRNLIKLTQNEINNLIYSLIKFGFKKIRKELDSPPNSLIHDIMLEVNNDITINHIIEKTILIIINKYKIRLRPIQIVGLKEHMIIIADIFMKEPYELRNDLGDDKYAEEFITKH